MAPFFISYQDNGHLGETENLREQDEHQYWLAWLLRNSYESLEGLDSPALYSLLPASACTCENVMWGMMLMGHRGCTASAHPTQTWACKPTVFGKQSEFRTSKNFHWWEPLSLDNDFQISRDDWDLKLLFCGSLLTYQCFSLCKMINLKLCSQQSPEDIFQKN